MSAIYHITTGVEWQKAERKGYYEAPSLKVEGFIHCSTREQIPGVRDRYFQGISELVIIEIDTEKLSSPLKYERSASVNEDFPHIYGPIDLTAVTAVEPIGSPG